MNPFLVRGQTYTISINTGTSPGHPFYIQRVAGIGGTQYSTGVSAQGVMNGSITFAVDALAPSQLNYQCGYHGGMYGPINITGCASACPGDACNTGVCNADGTCSKVPLANNTACNDNNACTQTDTCQAGVCKGSNPKSCPAIDQCHVAGTCDAVSGCPTPSASRAKATRTIRARPATRTTPAAADSSTWAAFTCGGSTRRRSSATA